MWMMWDVAKIPDACVQFVSVREGHNFIFLKSDTEEMGLVVEFMI
jgi:hypothetical protein